MATEQCENAADVALDSLGAEIQAGVDTIIVGRSEARRCTEGRALYDVTLRDQAREQAIEVTVAINDEGALVACQF